MRPLLLLLLTAMLWQPELTLAQGRGRRAPKANRASAKSTKRAIVFVGMPGSGKSYISKKLARRLGLPGPLSSGDIVREAAGAAQLGPSEGRRVLAVAKDLAATDGDVGRRMATKARTRRQKTVIIEGFRTAADLRAFRRDFPDTVIVSVDVPTRLRHRRMLERGRAGEDTQAYLDKRDRQELQVGLASLMQHADVKVRVRSDDPVELDHTLSAIIGKVGPRPTP